MITISEDGKAVIALVDEKEKLQNEANTLTSEMLAIYKAYIEEMKKLSDRHEVIIAKMSKLDEAILCIVNN